MSPRYLLEVLVDVNTWIPIKIGVMGDEDLIGVYQDLRGSGDWAGVRLLERGTEKVALSYENMGAL